MAHLKKREQASFEKRGSMIGCEICLDTEAQTKHRTFVVAQLVERWLPTLQVFGSNYSVPCRGICDNLLKNGQFSASFNLFSVFSKTVQYIRK